MSEERPSYVYAIRAGDYVKIGKSDNPHGRINGFRTGNPHKIETITTIEVRDAHAAYYLERCLHARYDKLGFRHDREWFHWTAPFEAELLGLGAYWDHRPSGDNDCQSEYECHASTYLNRTIGTMVNLPSRKLLITEYPGARLYSRHLGDPRDCSYDAVGEHYHQVLAPILYRLSPDDNDYHVTAFANEYDDRFEVHWNNGIYSVMPKATQDRIAALIGSGQ